MDGDNELGLCGRISESVIVRTTTATVNQHAQQMNTSILHYTVSMYLLISQSVTASSHNLNSCSLVPPK